MIKLIEPKINFASAKDKYYLIKEQDYQELIKTGDWRDGEQYVFIFFESLPCPKDTHYGVIKFGNKINGFYRKAFVEVVIYNKHYYCKRHDNLLIFKTIGDYQMWAIKNNIPNIKNNNNNMGTDTRTKFDEHYRKLAKEILGDDFNASEDLTNFANFLSNRLVNLIDKYSEDGDSKTTCDNDMPRGSAANSYTSFQLFCNVDGKTIDISKTGDKYFINKTEVDAKTFNDAIEILEDGGDMNALINSIKDLHSSYNAENVAKQKKISDIESQIAALQKQLNSLKN